MSDAVSVGGLEATVGLIPRYLRNREADSSSSRHAHDLPLPPAHDSEAEDEFASLPGMRGISITEELRRRIVEAATPERRGARRVWFGVAVVAIVAVGYMLFPEAIAALLPADDPTL